MLGGSGDGSLPPSRFLASRGGKVFVGGIEAGGGTAGGHSGRNARGIVEEVAGDEICEVYWVIFGREVTG